MAFAAFSHPIKERFEKLVKLAAVRQVIKEKSSSSTIREASTEPTGMEENKLENPITVSRDEETNHVTLIIMADGDAFA